MNINKKKIYDYYKSKYCPTISYIHQTKGERMEFQLLPKHLFNTNLKKDEIDEEILRLYIQNFEKKDTSNENMIKYRLKFCDLRKQLSTKARAVTKRIIMEEVSKYCSTTVSEFKHVIEWYKKETTTSEEKLQCVYTVFTRDVIESGLAEIMEAQKIKYLDAYALPSVKNNKKERGHRFVGDIFTKQIKARKDTVS